jgi:hypothetical protein
LRIMSSNLSLVSSRSSRQPSVHPRHLPRRTNPGIIRTRPLVGRQLRWHLLFRTRQVHCPQVAAASPLGAAVPARRVLTHAHPLGNSTLFHQIRRYGAQTSTPATQNQMITFIIPTLVEIGNVTLAATFLHTEACPTSAA